jgi:hypothetical protein
VHLAATITLQVTALRRHAAIALQATARRGTTVHPRRGAPPAVAEVAEATGGVVAEAEAMLVLAAEVVVAEVVVAEVAIPRAAAATTARIRNSL